MMHSGLASAPSLVERSYYPVASLQQSWRLFSRKSLQARELAMGNELRKCIAPD